MEAPKSGFLEDEEIYYQITLHVFKNSFLIETEIYKDFEEKNIITKHCLTWCLVFE